MKEFEKKNDSDLEKMVHEKKRLLRESRFNMAGSRARNTKEALLLRKEVARIQTEQQRRNLISAKA